MNTPKARYKNNNTVVTYCGGRGSGKTLSMSTEGAFALIGGNNVFSNYPISFTYDGELYKSNVVDFITLYNMDKSVHDGFVLLDEVNLWVGSRSSMTTGNKLLAAWIQLIRKRNLSVRFTTQIFMSIDKMLREQTDFTVQCFDHYYRNRALGRGNRIDQTIIDWSGYGTGRPLYKWDDWTARNQNTRYQQLHGRRFWNIYNTWQEFDIMDAMSKVEIDRKKKKVGDYSQVYDNLPGIDIPYEEYRDEVLKIHKPGSVVSVRQLKGIYRNLGFDGSDSDLRRVMLSHFNRTEGGLIIE